MYYNKNNILQQNNIESPKPHINAIRKTKRDVKNMKDFEMRFIFFALLISYSLAVYEISETVLMTTSTIIHTTQTCKLQNLISQLFKV